MKVANIQYALALAATAFAAEKSDVEVLSFENFDSFIKSHDLVLAEFYAPWCGHCKNLAPEFDEAAATLKQGTDDIRLAKIDCDDNRDFCMEQDIQGFPTLYIYEAGELTGSYAGARKAEAIVSYMQKMAEPPVVEIKDEKALDSWLKENLDSHPITFVYTGDKANLETIEKVAKANRDSLKFLYTTDKKLNKKLGDLSVYKLDEETSSYEGDLSEAGIEQFVKENEFPGFAELDASNYARYINAGTPMLYAFCENDDHRAFFTEAITPYLKDLKGKANVVFLDAVKYGAHAQNVNLKEEFPAMVVHDSVSNKKFVHTQDEKLTKDTVSDFLKKFVNDEIKPSIKSQEEPDQTEAAVYTLVATKYDDVVLDDTKDVLVMYYAPWCGHCKNLKPIYEELAKNYQGNEKVVIAQLDHTENDVPDQITGYPTLKLYPAYDKENPIEFKSGGRTLEALTEFIIENGSFHSEPVNDDGFENEFVEQKEEL